MTSAVIEDRRSSALQVMSIGEVRRIVSSCTEYWDGADIMPLVDDVRKSLLDTHQQWNLADCDAAACACLHSYISYQSTNVSPPPLNFFLMRRFLSYSCVHAHSSHS
jgi:hypothetical protein